MSGTHTWTGNATRPRTTVEVDESVAGRLFVTIVMTESAGAKNYFERYEADEWKSHPID